MSFAVNGVMAATLVSRIPDLRGQLDLDNGALGLLLLAIAVGSVLTLPSTGLLIARFGVSVVVRLGAGFTTVGLSLAAFAASVPESVPATAVGLFFFGVGVGIWDVAMNVEAAEVERHLGRTIMPRFHAGWSMGSIVGSAAGIALVAAGAPMALHVAGVAVVVFALAARSALFFLPPVPTPAVVEKPRSAWREPRTLAVGVMLLSFAMVEGTANDWLSLGLIDGYDVPHWVGVSGFALFVSSMTVGRLLGPIALDRLGRAPVLWVTSAAAFAGTLLVVFGGVLPLVALGIVVWGLGASLGFPVGMSAAADDPVRAAARVSVVSTIGYGAFLAGPPLLGMLGDRIGTLDSLLVVAALMLPAALTVFAARPPRPAQAAGAAGAAGAGGPAGQP